MKYPSCDKDITEKASGDPIAQAVQVSQLNQQEMTEFRGQLKGKRSEKWISLAFATFFLFSGVVGVIKLDSSFPVWMIVASFIVSALLFISGVRCGKKTKELKRKLEGN